MNQNIINTINNLNTNPLYYMSLSSMELFHSNFWSWLMKTDYRYIGAFFDELKKIHTNDTVEITREDRHTDILIKVNDECYLIENKIKTLVDKEQLIQNALKVLAKGRTTVSQPPFTVPLDYIGCPHMITKTGYTVLSPCRDDSHDGCRQDVPRLTVFRGHLLDA